MVKLMADLGDREDRILTIVKGKYGLKTKNEAVIRIIDAYGDELLEPELRPEMIQELKRMEKQKHKFKRIDLDKL